MIEKQVCPRQFPIVLFQQDLAASWDPFRPCFISPLFACAGRPSFKEGNEFESNKLHSKSDSLPKRDGTTRRRLIFIDSSLCGHGIN